MIRITAILSTVVIFAILIVGVISIRSRAAGKIETLKQKVERYTQTIQTNPADAQAYYNRALAYRGLKEYQKAIADFTKVIELEPDNALAYQYRGLTYAFLGNNEQCTQDYAKFIELKP